MTAQVIDMFIGPKALVLPRVLIEAAQYPPHFDDTVQSIVRARFGTMRAVKVVYRAHFEEDRPYEREFNGIVHYEPISRTHEGLIQVLQVGQGEVGAAKRNVQPFARDLENAQHAAFSIEDRGRHQLLDGRVVAYLMVFFRFAQFHGLEDAGVLHLGETVEEFNLLGHSGVRRNRGRTGDRNGPSSRQLGRMEKFQQALFQPQ